MVKKYLVLVFIFFTRLLSAQTDANAGGSINVTDANGKKQGKWVVYNKTAQKVGYTDDEKVEEGNYVDGKRTGKWTEYYPNKTLKSVITYENNQPNGYCIMYHENGKIKEEGTWKNRRWVGAYKLYYENGQEEQEFNFSEMGTRVGPQKYYYENGQVMIEGNWADGQESGLLKRYYENGDIKSEENYNKGGVLDVATVKNYETKKPIEKAPEPVVVDAPPVIVPKTDKPNIGVFNGEGYWKLVNSNKQISMDGTFAKNKLMDGKKYIYSSDGMLTRIAVYKGGKYIGDAIIEDEK